MARLEIRQTTAKTNSLEAFPSGNLAVATQLTNWQLEDTQASSSIDINVTQR